MGNREDLVIGSVSVLEPWAMKPALALVMEAVGHLKFYSTRYMKQKALHSHRKYRESVAIHCEYTLFPPEFERSSLRKLDVDAREWRDIMVQSVTTGGEESSFVEKDRELISILTITGWPPRSLGSDHNSDSEIKCSGQIPGCSFPHCTHDEECQRRDRRRGNAPYTISITISDAMTVVNKTLRIPDEPPQAQNLARLTPWDRRS